VTDLFIAGEWRTPRAGGRREIRCPADGTPVATVAEAAAADVDDAVAAARQAFDHGPWPATPERDRGALLFRVAERLQADRAAFARAESLDTGKRLVESEYDVDDVVACLRYYGGIAGTDAGRVVDTGRDDAISRVVREPLGVCALITPWNYPLLQTSWKVAPALVAGNTFVLKPSELTPSTAVLLMRALSDAGLPAGVANLVLGSGPEVGGPLTEHPDVDLVSFTGGLPTGRRILAAAAHTVKRTAVELGVSLHGIVGTGPSGRITREDVQKAAAETGARLRQPAGGKGETRVLELTATQATIARRMVESATTIPFFTVSTDVDMSLIATLRHGARDERDAVPSINDFVVKAAAETLRQFPRFNASYVDGGKVECYSRINVGIAVATDDALLVPVVSDADQKSLAEIAADTRRLAEAARRRALQPEDLRDGTFTVSNLGMFGVRSFTALIDPPQVAILAVGGQRRAPVEAEGGGVTFRDVMTVTLTCDHRVVYGADGAQFLSRLRELLERPLALAL